MIQTELFKLLPLNYKQLVKYAKCDNSLETDLKLNKSSRSISKDLQEPLDQTIIPNVADESKNYLYSTIWTAILKADNTMVGDLCMYGEPNSEGEIEIGYGTYEEFQNKGFMTEIVKTFIEWAKLQVEVKSILASTFKTNVASYTVLEKNNFVKIGETETLYKWQLIMNRSNQ